MVLRHFSVLLHHKLIQFFWTGTSNSTKKRSPEEYYQINYDYEVFNNNSVDVEFSSDSLILPIPDDATVKDSSETSDKMSENNEDGDLKEHDFIDNLMYIYGSGSESNRKPLFTAPEIIVWGCILSIIGQVSTISLILVRKTIHDKNSLKKMFLYVISSFVVTNSVFVLGVFVSIW